MIELMVEEDGGECRPWFEEAFEARYLDLYHHRNPETAAKEAAFALDVLALGPGNRVLDVSCGPGYHVAALRERGIEAMGLDLSASLLSCAASSGGIVRGDMRYLPVSGPFDSVLTFYTTLGYFGEGENGRVLAEFARVLKRGGTFLIDHLNEACVRATLVPLSEREVKGRTIVETRWIEENPPRVLKRVDISGGRGGEKTYTESVRLYGEAELRGLLSQAGLAAEKVLGDFDGRPLTEDAPRMIFAGSKA